MTIWPLAICVLCRLLFRRPVGSNTTVCQGCMEQLHKERP